MLIPRRHRNARPEYAVLSPREPRPLRRRGAPLGVERREGLPGGGEGARQGVEEVRQGVFPGQAVIAREGIGLSTDPLVIVESGSAPPLTPPFNEGGEETRHEEVMVPRRGVEVETPALTRGLHLKRVVDTEQHRFRLAAKGMGKIFPPGEFRQHAREILGQVAILHALRPQDPADVQVEEQAHGEVKGRLPLGQPRREALAVEDAVDLLRIREEPQKPFAVPRRPGQGVQDELQIARAEVMAAQNAGADYVILDGRGGATGAAPEIFKKNISVPTQTEVQEYIELFGMNPFESRCE